MAKMHEGSTKLLDAKTMEAHVQARVTAITIPKKVTLQSGDGVKTVDNADYEDKVKYEYERGKEGWAATCSCGWEGNNPLPYEGAAKEAIEEHFASVQNRLEGLGG